VEPLSFLRKALRLLLVVPEVGMVCEFVDLLESSALVFDVKDAPEAAPVARSSSQTVPSTPCS
jgi:hypothetical protein